ncbi:MAG: Lipopolysaccharide core heptosyltransferase RfaQ [Ignavibacteria bacterium]|nr:Lipopolysaccharide core heptosyltransferase RfaQ [Ignavibacteria bacterium]
MKILINALSGIGDALMFSPSLKLLKEKIPGSRIDMLVMFKSVKEMYETNPHLDNVYLIRFMNQSKLKSFKEIRNLKMNEYDFSINVYPSNRIEYNLVNAFLGAKKKISHHYLHTNFFRAEFLNDILVDEVKDRHNVLQNADIVKRIVPINDEEVGRMELFTENSHDESAADWINKNNTDNRLLIGFHAGSALLKNHIHKRWDKRKFAELGKILIEKYNVRILLFGNEAELNNEIKNLIGENAILASTENFMDSVTRMKHCRLFISNDTAFLHCAAALQLPVVGIFAYTNYKELYPWKTEHIIVRKELDCSPCFYNSPKPAACIFTGYESFKCMKTIEIHEVLDAINTLLNKSN